MCERGLSQASKSRAISVSRPNSSGEKVCGRREVSMSAGATPWMR